MHVITGAIRKAPFTKTGSNAKGEWRMYAVELSESWKDRDGNRQYTNYKAVLFASTPGGINYNDEVLVEGSVVSISAETLQIVSREHNGKTYTQLEMIQPRVVFAKSPELPSVNNNNQRQQQPQQQQSQQQQNQQQANNEPPMDFDESIPF